MSALKAHTWSNLILAGDTPPSSQPNIPNSSDNKDSNDDNIGSILESLSVEDGDDINFEDLFSQLTKMKEVSKNLPENERKAYAEKVLGNIDNLQYGIPMNHFRLLLHFTNL